LCAREGRDELLENVQRGKSRSTRENIGSEMRGKGVARGRNRRQKIKKDKTDDGEREKGGGRAEESDKDKDGMTIQDGSKLFTRL